MDLTIVFIAAFAAAFVVSVVDYWIDLGIWRAAIAAASSTIAIAAVWPNWPTWIVYGLASSFLTMAFLQIIERVNSYRGMRR